ncbi:MAG TPA: TadE/TadG family type IV pilus assembly protein, partial [Pirellulales bacterium]
VMVLPVVMFVMILVVEAALVMTAKNGVTYAAFAAARAAAVWLPASGPEIAQEKAREAAVVALAAFANGINQPELRASDGALEDAFVSLYREATDDPAAENYLRRKFRAAVEATSVELEESPADGEPWRRDVTAIVRFRYKFHLPITARLLGRSDGRAPLVSRATLALEIPQNADGALGISYASP